MIFFIFFFFSINLSEKPGSDFEAQHSKPSENQQFCFPLWGYFLMLHLKLKIKVNLRQQFWKDQMWREGLYKCLSSKTANSVQPVLLCCCARCYSHRQCWAPSPVLLGPVKAEHRHWQSQVLLERAGERGEPVRPGRAEWSLECLGDVLLQDISLAASVTRGDPCREDETEWERGFFLWIVDNAQCFRLGLFAVPLAKGRKSILKCVP